MEKRIICKVHDNNEVIIKVGVEREAIYPVIVVWNEIKRGAHTFYTFENNKKASVKARTSSTGRKYLTTSPDGVTENNLDELTTCPV